MSDSTDEKAKPFKRDIPPPPKIGVDFCSHVDLPKIPISVPSKGSIGRTGEWRTFRPVLTGKCTGCGNCWAFCPEACVTFKEEKLPVIDLEYCKGCGICVNECPAGCLTMERETRENQDA